MQEWWQAADGDLLAGLQELQTRLHSTYAEMLTVIAEADSRQVGATEGFGTTADLLHYLQRIPRSQARARVAAAADLLPGRAVSGEPVAPRLPETAAALADGVIGAEHVAVVRSVLARLPRWVDTERRAEIEAELGRHARTLDAQQLAILGRRILALLDQDGPAPKEEPEPANRLALHPTDHGCEFSGQLDGEAAAAFQAALSPLAAPRGEADPRSTEQRNGDALAELARRALDVGDLPTEGGERPHLTVLVPLEVLEARARAAMLDWVGPISAEAARRLACDARVVPVVLGAKSEPLDVGRVSYTVPAGMRRAVIARDRGCAFPGCAVVAAWCECHHVRHWADGGETRIDNLVLLCGRHHRLVHHSQWQVRIRDGNPEFHPPGWIDTEPRRNPLHHPLRT